jgi:hypothetical protein
MVALETEMPPLKWQGQVIADIDLHSVYFSQVYLGAAQGKEPLEF